uniref:Uncharacterized protein n=1 Tax=Oryza rufipogon TaxID=4529 RepID=A0A0E0N6G6_ORYRU
MPVDAHLHVVSRWPPGRSSSSPSVSASPVHVSMTTEQVAENIKEEIAVWRGLKSYGLRTKNGAGLVHGSPRSPLPRERPPARPPPEDLEGGARAAAEPIRWDSYGGEEVAAGCPSRARREVEEEGIVGEVVVGCVTCRFGVHRYPVVPSNHPCKSKLLKS